jgi:phosphoglycolate phosphatase-like HAD superfamily hydrolase
MIIFDLDQTLIDSSAAEPLRRSRRWNDVYSLIPSLMPYPGIPELLAELQNRDHSLAIVTSSPKTYCSRVIQHWNWPIDNLVAYHDTKRHKPEPEPLLMAISRGTELNAQNFHVGDTPADTQAAKAAGIISLAAMWGSTAPEALEDSAPDHIFSTVDEITTFLLDS